MSELETGVDVSSESPSDAIVSQDSPDVAQVESTQEPGEGQAVESVSQDNNSDAIMQELSRVREELSRQRERSEFLERMAFNQKQEPVTQEEPEMQYDPDDLPSYKNVESLMEKRNKGLEKRLQQMETAYQQQIVNTVEQAARQKYSDYDTVLETFTAELIKGNQAKGIAGDPGILTALKMSSNPAELAYRIGKTHPDFGKTAMANGVKNVSNKINKNLSQPGTLSSTPKSMQKETDSYWNTVSDADFELERMKRKGLLE